MASLTESESSGININLVRKLNPKPKLKVQHNVFKFTVAITRNKV